MLDEFEENVREYTVKYIKTFAMDIVVVIVAAAYILYQMVSLEPTNVNPIILIASAIVGIICGIVIKQALGENGFSKGYNSPIWNEEKEKYDKSCNSAIQHVPLVDNFYLFEEKDKKENFRRVKLQSLRLRYQDWFNLEGEYIGKQEDYDKLTRLQKWGLNKAIRVRIYQLNLFSEYSSSVHNPKEKETTDKDQRTKNFSKNTISAILIAIIGVYFIPVLNNWNWASLIASTMQVALWVLFGIVQLYTNYNFVVQDKVATLRKKKELIAKFIKGAEEGLYNHPPFYKEPEPEIKEEELTMVIEKPITMDEEITFTPVVNEEIFEAVYTEEDK